MKMRQMSSSHVWCSEAKVSRSTGKELLLQDQSVSADYPALLLPNQVPSLNQVLQHIFVLILTLWLKHNPGFLLICLIWLLCRIF